MNLSIMVKNYKGKVCNMYQDEYKRWLAADLEDADLKPELAKIEGNDDEIKDRFAVALKFGTAGLRAAEEIRKADTEVVIIFITNMAQYAIRGYAVDALDYVLKPVSYFAFSQRLNRAISRMKKREQKVTTY